MSDWSRMSNPEGAFSLGAYEWRDPRATTRAEPPAKCYGCGREMSDADVNVRGAFCSGECESRAGWSQR